LDHRFPPLAHANYPSDLPKISKKDMGDLVHSGTVLPFPQFLSTKPHVSCEGSISGHRIVIVNFAYGD
jgi:hypothetical protein